MSNALPLNFCFSSLGCPQLDINSIFRLAQQWGFRGVELRAASGQVDIVGALTQCYGMPAQMAAAVRSSGVGVAALDSSLRLLSAETTHKTEVLALAQWADALAVPFIRVFDGESNSTCPADSEIKEMLDTLGWWHRMKREHRFQCDLMIETHWVLTNPELVAALAAAAPYPIHLLWDSFHTWKASGVSVSTVWEQLKPHVRHVHFKDGKINSEAPRTTSYCLPGDGDFPLRELFEVLSRDQFSGWVSLEWERLWHPYLPALEEALAQGKKFKWW